MDRILLDGKFLQRTVQGYEYLKHVLQFPDSFGKNLDALYDLLTEIGTDTEIYIHSEEEMDERMKKVFLNALKDNERLNIVLTK